MKQLIKRMACIMIGIVLLTGCGTIDRTGDTPGSQTKLTDNDQNDITDDADNNSEGEPTDSAENYTFNAEVIEAGEWLLVTPDAESDAAKSADKISVNTIDAVITGLDGEKLKKDNLKAGDFVKITYDGFIRESYPAQIGASAIEVTGHNILIDGYLALIDDLYQDDSALNYDITMIALDTTGWSGLSEIEKEIIFSSVREIYGYDVIEGTFDELSEQGLMEKENLYFPKGILISLKKVSYDESKKKITCAIEKWRSGLGAIGSDDVTAKYKDGEWKIKKEGMWIS